MNNTMIKIDNVSKQYRLGVIGGGTLRGDIQSITARILHKEDPNVKIGKTSDEYEKNQRFLALDGVSFCVNKGDTLGIIGHNGAGKSTLLKLLSRVTAPTSGTISYNGRISSMLEVGTGFHPELTGRENVYLNGAILGMTKAEITKKFDEIVSFAEMERFIDTPVKRYSSGMYVKLAFAVAAHLDSEILVMDEVLAVGDAKFQQKCLGKMGNVAATDGRTVLYVSHNMNTIRQLCNRCVVLDKGKLIYDGDVDSAIQIYMDNNADMNTVINLDNKKRPRFAVPLPRLHMTEVSLVDKNDIFYSASERLTFRLKWRAIDDVHDAKLRVFFKFADDTPVGMAVSDLSFSAKKGEECSSVFSCDISSFATGRYSAFIFAYDMRSSGLLENLDGVDNAFFFEVKNENALNWFHSVWGHTVLPEIKVLE